MEKLQEVKVQEAEGDRRAAELLATVQRQAEAERKRIRILAEAERQRAVIEAEGAAKAIVLRLQSEAEGQARAIRLLADAEAAAITARGEAEAGARRLMGLAEAETIRARGMAEAESLQRRVAALNEQNQAAILDTALFALPEIAGKLFEAYGKIGNVTYIAAGQGEGMTGRIAQDVAGMVPMLGAVLESTTGIKLRELIAGQGQPAGFVVLPVPEAQAAVRVDAVPASGPAESGAFGNPATAAAPLNGHLEQAGAAPATA